LGLRLISWSTLGRFGGSGRDRSSYKRSRKLWYSGAITFYVSSACSNVWPKGLAMELRYSGGGSCVVPWTWRASFRQ
jgi:hypothetical protein